MFVEVKKTNDHNCDLLEIYSTKKINSFILSSAINHYKNSIFGGLYLEAGKGVSNNVYVLKEPLTLAVSDPAQIEVIGVYTETLNSEKIFLVEMFDVDVKIVKNDREDIGELKKVTHETFMHFVLDNIGGHKHA